MYIKTESDSYSFNKNKNKEIFNAKLSSTKYKYSVKTTYCNTDSVNSGKFLEKYNSKNNSKKEELKSHNNSYFKNYFNNSIKKSSILLNADTINKLNINNIIGEKVVFKKIIKPFDKIKYLNVKNLKIKPDIMPLINNKINKEILKNKSIFLTIDKKQLKLNRFRTSQNNFKRKLLLSKNFSKINFFNDYEKDFFPGIDYSNLEYNEHEIYKNKSIYDNIIKDKINYFKNNQNENKTIKLEKIFHYGKSKKEIKLTLESLKITLEETTPGIKNSNLKIDFPFALLPIFYYKGSDSFQKLLAAVIKVGNNFESIFLDDNKISAALNNIIDYQTMEKNESAENESDDFNNSLYNYISYKKKRMAKRIDDKPISIRPLILQKSKDFLKFNHFIFFWITNTNNLAAKITLPCVTLNILETNTTIAHFLDYEFLFFLYKNNFVNWEYYIIRHLSNYSKFRYIFQKLDSFNKVFNKIIFLKEEKTKINTFKEEVLFNIYTDKFYVNHIILFKSFYVIIGFIDSNYIYEKKYHIYFSFLQFIKLFEISNYSTKIEFLIKFLEINNDIHTLNFNFKEYDSFDIKVWMNNIKKFSETSLIKRNKGEENLTADLEIYKKKINIEFKRPQWTIIKFENDKEVIKTWEIGKDMEVDLVKSILYENTENWTNLLNKCLKKLNEPVPQVLLSLRKKQNKKKRKHRPTSYSNYSGYSNYSSGSSSSKSKDKRSTH